MLIVQASLTITHYEKPISTVHGMLEEDLPVYSYFAYQSDIKSTGVLGNLARHIERKNVTLLE